MTSHKDTRIVWQVQSRASSKHKWVNRGRFEVRSAARTRATELRVWRGLGGWGNTRVVRVELPHRAKQKEQA